MERGLFIETQTMPMDVEKLPSMQHLRRRPEHLVLIVAGHREWAKQHQMSYGNVLAGGAARIIELIHGCVDRGISQLTVCGYGSDLWLLPPTAANGMLPIFYRFLSQSAEELHEKRVRVVVRGDTSRLDQATRSLLRRIETITHHNEAMQLVLALDYRQPWQPVRRTASVLTTRSQRTADQAVDMPEPDLVVRTGGSLSMATGLIWDTQRTSIYVSDSLWPDFDLDELENAMQWFARKHREQWVHMTTCAPTP
mgnify:FL=1